MIYFTIYMKIKIKAVVTQIMLNLSTHYSVWLGGGLDHHRGW